MQRFLSKNSEIKQSLFVLAKVKSNYENIEMEGLEFTIKWSGALIAEVSDVLDNSDDDIGGVLNLRKVSVF